MLLYSVYYISVGSSTRFGCWHPSSGAGTTVITASVTGQLQWILYIDSSVFYSLQLTSARSCNYSCTSSWRWVSTPKTCRAVYRNIINWIQTHLVGQLFNMIYYFIPSEITIIKYILYIKKDYVLHFNILVTLPVTNTKGITTGKTLLFFT